MNKFVSVPLDVVDEILAGNIDKLASVIEPLSEQAKTAYVPSLDEQNELNERDFALVMWSPKVGQIKKYATYTPELTELNLAYLSDKSNWLPDEILKIAGTNLIAAANNYGINVPDNLKQYEGEGFIDNALDIRTIDQTKLLDKAAAKEETLFALPSKNKYPLETSAQVKKASVYFEKNHKKMDENDTLEFALNVIKRADDLDVPIKDTEVSKYAELDFETFNKSFYDNIQVRKSYLRDNEDPLSETYDDLLRRSDDWGVVKTAEVLYEIDKKAELTGTYGKGIDTPAFAVAGKVGSEGMDIDGNYITGSSIDSIPSGELTTIVGNDVIDDLRGDDKLDVLKSLPTPVRKEIIDLM